LGNLDAATRASVLGFAANDLVDPLGFSGDFAYHQPSPQGDLKTIYESAQKVFQRYLQNREGKAPKRVFVYRNGCSEGQLPQVLMYEVHALRKLIEKEFNGASKLVYIVSTKLHKIRLTPKNPTGSGGREQNLEPGVVVDREITHPSFSEFYLVGHRAQQGTAKIPRYSVLCNDAKATLHDIQETTFHLCFGHQIITSPVSLPSPVYIAEMYAKRGRNVYNSASNTQRVQNILQVDEDDVHIDYELLTHALSLESFEGGRSKRVNA